MSSLTIAVVIILSLVVMVPVFIIGIIADAINRWFHETRERDND